MGQPARRLASGKGMGEGLPDPFGWGGGGSRAVAPLLEVWSWGLPVPGSILSLAGGVPCPTWRGTLVFLGRKWGFVQFSLHPFEGCFGWGHSHFLREGFPSSTLESKIGGGAGSLAPLMEAPAPFGGETPSPCFS